MSAQGSETSEWEHPGVLDASDGNFALAELRGPC